MTDDGARARRVWYEYYIAKSFIEAAPMPGGFLCLNVVINEVVFDINCQSNNHNLVFMRSTDLVAPLLPPPPGLHCFVILALPSF